MKKIPRILFLFLLMGSSAISYAQEKTIKVNDSSDPNGPYAVEMLKLAFKHLDKKYTVSVGREPYSQSRILEEINNGNLDVFWTSANAEKEAEFRPIRIPLYKGLLGYRVFIINKNNQSKFDNIHTLEDLKKISIGQGKTWADAGILEANGLNVVKANKYESLFYMVEGGRFDAFSRGVHEPYGELAQHPQLKDLTVEKNLMLVYKMPLYLFVAKNNTALAADIELGLNRAIADGSFDQTFYGAPAVKDVIAKIGMKNRRIIKIDNPTLSKETPLDHKELWLDPQTLPDN